MRTENAVDSMSDREQILKYHHAHAWQPFTQMKLVGDPLIVERAEGVHLFTPDGQDVIDAVGSWWVSIFGHNHPDIKKAVVSQLDRLDQVMYASITHEGAANLSARLAAKTNQNLPRVFFSDNGSTAVEIALKMAFQANVNLSRPEKRGFIALSKGYHGDTVGTMSVGAREVFHAVYEPLLYPCFLVRQPVLPFVDYHNESSFEKHLSAAIDDVHRVMKENPGRICAFILEPLIQGAGGMNFYPPYYLRKIRELCDEFDIALVADEVFTGCGRTGSFFAFEKAGVWPDLIALSKGLSAGVVPFAATLASEKIYQAFYSDDRSKTFFHGHSMTGSPIGCAAALASLDLYDAGAFPQKLLHLEKNHETHLRQIASGPLAKRIREIRYLGSVAALELSIPDGYTGNFSPVFLKKCLENGALLRPLGNVIYLTPPYTITPAELAKVYEIIEKVLHEMLPLS